MLEPSLRMEKNESTPPPIPCAFICLPSNMLGQANEIVAVATYLQKPPKNVHAEIASRAIGVNWSGVLG